MTVRKNSKIKAKNTVHLFKFMFDGMSYFNVTETSESGIIEQFVNGFIST